MPVSRQGESEKERTRRVLEGKDKALTKVKMAYELLTSRGANRVERSAM